MKTPLENEINKAMFECLEKENPLLVEVLREVVRAGGSVKRISESLARRYPTSLTASAVACAAQYMKDNPGLTAKKIK